MMERNIVKLNLGCGHDIKRDPRDNVRWVNVDIRDFDGVDIVADLEEEWPFGDSSFSFILAEHVFEHLEDPVHFMDEAHRVLVAVGSMRLVGPYWKHKNAFSDPTHKRALTENTFNHFLEGNRDNEDVPLYTDRTWEVVGTRRRWTSWHAPVRFEPPAALQFRLKPR